MISDKAQKTAVRYLGDEARDYERRRAGQRKWEAEGRMVEAFLGDLPRGTSVLDCPCGTGRFISRCAHRRLEYLGIDASPDMIEQCEFRLRPMKQPNLSVRVGSIFALDLTDKSVDVAICIRFANLIKPPDLTLALKELQRVTRSTILMNLRIGQKDERRYHDPHAIETVEQALSGWKIAENAPIHEESYRLLTIRAVG